MKANITLEIVEADGGIWLTGEHIGITPIGFTHDGLVVTIHAATVHAVLVKVAEALALRMAKGENHGNN